MTASSVQDHTSFTQASIDTVRTLHIGNLARNLRPDDEKPIRDQLEKAGGPCESFAMRNGYAFMTYQSHKLAVRAKRRMRDLVIDGHRVRVEISHTKVRLRAVSSRSQPVCLCDLSKPTKLALHGTRAPLCMCAASRTTSTTKSSSELCRA